MVGFRLHYVMFWAQNKLCLQFSNLKAQTHGQTERVNMILEDMLRHYVSPNQDNWDHYLSLVEFAYNNAWQESIQTIPYMLNYSQHPLTSLNIGISRRHVPAAKDLV